MKATNFTHAHLARTELQTAMKLCKSAIKRLQKLNKAVETIAEQRELDIDYTVDYIQTAVDSMLERAEDKIAEMEKVLR